MKTHGFSLLIALFLTVSGCYLNNRGHQYKDECLLTKGHAGENFLIRGLKEELKTSKQIEKELALLVDAIRSSKTKEADLIALLGKRLEKSDILISLLKSIDIVIDMRLMNIKNTRTFGYKRIEAIFDGERLAATQHVMTQGNLRRTDNPLDLAIQGPGFFQIEMPDGAVAYTRNGNFMRGAAGQIITTHGYELLDAPTLSDKCASINISEDGAFNVTLADGTQRIEGHIQLVTFVNPEALRSIHNYLFEATEVTGIPVTSSPGSHGRGIICQGFLENSNVSIPEEIIALNTLQTWKNGIEKAILILNGYDNQ
jgi:flagellar basal body rod protein FlgG